MACCFTNTTFTEDGCIIQFRDASGNVKQEINLTNLILTDQQNGLLLEDGVGQITLSADDQTTLGLNRVILEGLRASCMVAAANSDYYLELARGNIAGQTQVLIRGHNPSQSSASGFVDVSEFGDLSYLSSAETMDVVSTSVNDTSAGTGMRTMLIQGVDDTGAEIQEMITMNGTTPVTTVNSYLRVNFLVGLTVGTLGWNDGNITATASLAATIQCETDATESISQNSHYTVPLGKTGYLLQVELNAAKTSGGSLPVVEWKGYARLGGVGSAWLQLFDKKMDAGVTDELDVNLPTPSTGFAERTDIRLRTDTDQNSTEVRSRMYILLIDN